MTAYGLMTRPPLASRSGAVRPASRANGRGDVALTGDAGRERRGPRDARGVTRRQTPVRRLETVVGARSEPPASEVSGRLGHVLTLTGSGPLRAVPGVGRGRFNPAAVVSPSAGRAHP